jgi:hypothetical protein
MQQGKTVHREGAGGEMGILARAKDRRGRYNFGESCAGFWVAEDGRIYNDAGSRYIIRRKTI